jgi:hypothetical protein
MNITVLFLQPIAGKLGTTVEDLLNSKITCGMVSFDEN